MAQNELEVNRKFTGRLVGTLRTLDGTEHWFCNCIYNGWAKRREFQVGDEWLTESQVQDVRFHFATRKESSI